MAVAAVASAALAAGVATASDRPEKPDRRERAEAAPAPPAPPLPEMPSPPAIGTWPLEGWFSKPRLGVELVETTPELRVHLGGESSAGVLVSRILRGTPAETAGLAVGDMIVAVDGEPIATSRDLVRELEERVGRTFSIEIVRDRERRKLEVRLPDPARDVPTGPRV